MYVCRWGERGWGGGAIRGCVSNQAYKACRQGSSKRRTSTAEGVCVVLGKEHELLFTVRVLTAAVEGRSI